MKYLVILAVATVCGGARLDHSVSLPAGASLSGGADADLQAPLQHAHTAHHAAHAQILRYENDISQDGYHYAYETSDGTKAEQDGQVVRGAVADEATLKVAGSYSYVGADGQTYSVTYTADENGYHPAGDHLPTAPPVPADILRSLQLTDTRNDQYSSHKSSYDADAGL